MNFSANLLKYYHTKMKKETIFFEKIF